MQGEAESEPEVTVVIPTRDRWPSLSRALAGALHQEDVGLEVVVVDDGSVDETPRRLAACSDSRLRTLRHSRPLGVSRARNDGVAAARGAWVAFLDDDDLWAPRKLREQLDAAASAGATMAYSAAVVVDADHRPVGIDSAPAPDGLLRMLLHHNAIPGGCSNVLARTHLVRELGGFDEELSMLADWDLWIRLARGGAVAACPAVHVAYVDHGAGMHVRHDAAAASELARLGAKHRELLGRPEVASGVWFLLLAASGQRLAGHRLQSLRGYLSAALRHRSKGALLRALVGPFSDRLARRDVLHGHEPAGEAPPWLELYFAPGAELAPCGRDG